MSTSLLQGLQTTFTDGLSRPALVHRDRTYSYAELHVLACQSEGWLQGLGVKKGDRVVLCTSDKLAFLAGYLGTLYAGAIALPLNPRFTREELRYFLADSGARIAIVGAEARSAVESMKPDLPELRAVIPDRLVLEPHGTALQHIDIGPDDACMIMYSSGTTGWPKGVVHTHANVASGLRAL